IPPPRGGTVGRPASRAGPGVSRCRSARGTYFSERVAAMSSRAVRAVWGVAVPACVAAVLGAAAPGTAGGEEAVRKAFTDFQAALKAKDAAKVWQLLDDDSQADAERSATKLRQDYNKAGPEKKAQLEKLMGLPGPELAKLKGEGFLK